MRPTSPSFTLKSRTSGQSSSSPFTPCTPVRKYSKLKLGKMDDEPEFNTVTLFMICFHLRHWVGLFFYGRGEPIHHSTGKNRYTADYFMHDNTVSQKAISLTPYHWRKIISLII